MLCGICIIAVGFPCQPHSSAGMQRHTDDERDLFLTLLDLLFFVQPEVLMLENVMGFFNSSLVDVARHFAASIEYSRVTHLVNCASFLPQKRVRGCLMFCKNLSVSQALKFELPRLDTPTLQSRAVLAIESPRVAAELASLNLSLIHI